MSRLSGLAGGPDLDDAVDDGDHGGITGGLTARLDAAIGDLTVVRVDARRVAPHPFNDPSRSVPQPGDADWDELAASVRSQGVKIPGVLVTRAAFVEARPALATAIGDADWVAIYGARRRAAVLFTKVFTFPAVVDDGVMADNGDLDLMALENRGRKDLSEFADADMFARYSEEVGLGQRAIADRLGVDQGTVSRRMALLLLAPELREAVEATVLPSARAAALAGTLPYGPRRRWQKKFTAEQDSPERRDDQITALHLITSGRSPADAAQMVLATRAAREQAARDDLQIVDPMATFGRQAVAHQLFEDAAIAAARDEGTLVAAIDDQSGALLHYTTQTRDGDRARADTGDDAEQRAAASRARRTAAARLVAAVPGREKIMTVLLEQYACGVAELTGSREAVGLAHRWSRAAGIPIAGGTAGEYRAAAAELDGHARGPVVWALAVAAYEIRAAAAARSWDHSDITYLDLLRGAGHQPTPWERVRLERARQLGEAHEDPVDGPAAADTEREG